MSLDSALLLLLLPAVVVDAALTVKSLKQTATACRISSHGSHVTLKYDRESDRVPYVRELVCKEGYKKGFFGIKKTLRSSELGAFGENRELLAPFFADWRPKPGLHQNAYNCVAAARHLHHKLKSIYYRAKKWWYRIPGRASYRFMEFLCALKYQKDGPALFMQLLSEKAHTEVIIGKLKAAKDQFNDMHESAVLDEEEEEGE
ncbi:hypothetical protein FOZ61_005203 [Perkinsus olseni]|uniref:Uncharacterized protein n=1 Tax=Perkinsus olseni TaxID=32597 RepID=A0A7J6LIM7_PEROL|nr:hypothetical protein FOZ61_005203 [Perkinsus olseni]KAF4663539.1 hypothetical protein FOL46_004693 [Perkinsus olseni]